MVFIIFVVIAMIAIIATVVTIVLKKEKIKTLEKEELVSHYENVNRQILASLKNQYNFNKIFSIRDAVSGKFDEMKSQLVLCDTINQKICFIDYKTEQPFIVSNEDVLNYQIIQNTYKESYTSTIRMYSGSHTGHSYGNNYSSFGGGSSRSQSEGTVVTKVKEFKLVVRYKSLETPEFTINLIPSQYRSSLTKSGQTYSQINNSLQAFISYLEVVLSMNKKTKKNSK